MRIQTSLAALAALAATLCGPTILAAPPGQRSQQGQPGQQGQQGQPQNVGNPPLIHWQRTLEDAVQLAKAKKLPLLVVANQDEEIACESLANDRYRSPAFAALANRYVAVIASVFRHNPRDHDDQGRRIPCPRFGCVTCGEHVAMEPQLFEKYFNGQRTAPRHIGIGTDGKELFDRFLDRDLGMIDRALRDHADQRRPMPALRSGDQSIQGLLRSRAQADRDQLEAKFIAAPADQRLQILDRARRSGNEQSDLVRLALACDDAALRRAAVATMAATATPHALPVLLHGLGTARSDAEYRGLMTGLARAATSDDTCRRALTIRQALAARAAVDPAQWTPLFEQARGAIQSEVVPNEELATLEERIDGNTKKARQGDAGGRLAFQVAQDTFRFALNRVQQQKDPTFLLLDALAATGRAVKAGLPEVQATTLRARIHLLLDQPEQAAPFTTAALIGADGPGPAAAQAAAPWTAALLAIYARQQVALASRPFTAEADFPKDAVREAHGAWSTLTAHPAATEAHCEEHIGFLLGLHARRATAAAIRHAVGRFPSAARLHELFRDQALWAGGATGLARAYDALDATGDHRAATEWFAGYAALLAAESLVRDRDLTAAPPIYHKAIAAFDRSVAANAGYRPTASHYVALAHGGIARLALDGARYGEAVDAVLAGARSNPAAFPLVDGLKNTLKRTTTRLRRRVRDAPELKARLEDGLRTLRLLDE